MFKKDLSDELLPKNSSGKKTLILALLLLLLVAGGGFGWSFYKYQQTKKDLAKAYSAEGQKELAKKEIDEILDRVRKHIVLPADEEPVIATITDKDLLASEQPFYKNAHNGDRVIAYMTARKAIIYDPVNDVIVNAGPIYVDAQAQDQQMKSSSTPEKK